jgi:hypothetical protein
MPMRASTCGTAIVNNFSPRRETHAPGVKFSRADGVFRQIKAVFIGNFAPNPLGIGAAKVMGRNPVDS